MAEFSQDDIDALLGGGGGIPDPEPPAPAAPKADAAGELNDQASIDALFSGAAAASSSSQSDIDALFGGGGASAGGGAFDQGSIDDLLNKSSDSTMDDMQSLLASIQNDPNLGSSSNEVNIDELLNEINTETALSQGSKVDHTDIQSLMDSVQIHHPGEQTAEEEGVNIDFLLDMKLNVTFEVGRSIMKIGDLLSVGQGSVIELHRLVGEDLDLFVSGRLIAKGEVVVVNEKFGVRILSIVSPAERIKHMGGMDKLT